MLAEKKYDDCYLKKSAEEEILSGELCLSPHFDAGVDGADEEDVGEHDEDGDVQAKHEWCAVAEGRRRVELGSCAHQATPCNLIKKHISWLQFGVSGETGRGDLP